MEVVHSSENSLLYVALVVFFFFLTSDINHHSDGWVYVVLCPEAPEGSTGSGYFFKRGHERLGEPGIELGTRRVVYHCSPVFH